jgi:hypothetical protein
MYTLHKLPEGFIITSDEEINNFPFLIFTNGKPVAVAKGTHDSECKKVIAQQDQIDFSALSEDEQKEIGWFDVESLATELVPNRNIKTPFGSNQEIIPSRERKTFIRGFQKAQELLSDGTFLLDDIKSIFYEGIQWGINQVFDGKLANNNEINDRFNRIIKSVIESTPQSWPVELETECSVCSNLSGNEHKLSCKSLTRFETPRLTNGKVKIIRIE